MITCSLAIIIQGTIDTGGIDHIVKTNYEHGRLNFFKYVAKPIYLIVGILQHVITTVSKIIFFPFSFDMDPTIRVATVSALLGQLFMSLSIFGCQQNFVQRYCSMDSLKTVRRTLWTNVPVIAVLFSLSWIAGMVIFADYINCDPLKLGYISKIDEIVPFYVEDKFTHIPGLLGVFMASLFNGALRCVEKYRELALKLLLIPQHAVLKVLARSCLCPARVNLKLIAKFCFGPSSIQFRLITHQLIFYLFFLVYQFQT